jgi:hypothetical protein
MDSAKQIDVIKLIKPLKMDLVEKNVKILMALSDNKGYGEYQLAKMIGSSKSYVNGLLKELSSDNFGCMIDSYSIQSFHIKDSLSLLHKLQDQRDYLSKYIFKNMPNEFKENLANSDLRMIRFLLALILDSFLIDVNLYNKERFFGVKLSEDAKKLLTIKEHLKMGSIRILNRILIEDAYPDEICKTRIPLIYLGGRRSPNGSKHPYFINLDLRTFLLIVEDLESKIVLDRSQLEKLLSRLNSDMREYSGFEDFFLERSELEKGIKEGNYDIHYYRDRYEKNINILMQFMTSNYVGELMKKFGYKDILKKALLIKEFDYAKFFEISLENGYISADEMDELKLELVQKIIANGSMNEFDQTFIQNMATEEETRQDDNNIKFNI